MDRKFIERWVADLFENLEESMNEDELKNFLIENGRDCARGGAVKHAQEKKGNLEGFLELMRSWLGEDKVARKGNVINVVYSRCLCPLVAEGPEILPESYCLCSTGWLHEMFETVTGSSVEVELGESIKRSGKSCSFTVTIQG
jgi:hypothetical protein